eukprot:gene23074-30266_t
MQQAVTKKQIFDPKGAFLMLSRLLQSMQEQMFCNVFIATLGGQKADGRRNSY